MLQGHLMKEFTRKYHGSEWSEQTREEGVHWEVTNQKVVHKLAQSHGEEINAECVNDFYSFRCLLEVGACEVPKNPLDIVDSEGFALVAGLRGNFLALYFFGFSFCVICFLGH